MINPLLVPSFNFNSAELFGQVVKRPPNITYSEWLRFWTEIVDSHRNEKPYS